MLLIGLPIALLLASAAGYAVAAGALRPVERMRRRAAGISDGDGRARGCRCPAADDELRRLGETLNEMLERLGGDGASNEREFLSTASHELRTPLAILKAEIEVALHPESTPEDWRGALVSAREETDRLVRLAEDLLLLARGEDGAAPRRSSRRSRSRRSPSGSLSATRRRRRRRSRSPRRAARARRARRARPRAHQPRRQRAPLRRRADRRCRRARDGEWVELHVTDHGGGFAPEYLPRAFERFSRPAGARGGGAGLGLALVEAVAHAHGGTAGAANAPGGADVWLPAPAGAELLNRALGRGRFIVVSRPAVTVARMAVAAPVPARLASDRAVGGGGLRAARARPARAVLLGRARA